MRLVLGVAGHVDHGKTALVAALSGMQTDRLPEERARGISIVLGFAHLRLDGHEIDLIDMPGHERFVRVMVAGATGMDALLLVVDAREGVMPQTREHAEIAALLGVHRAILAVGRTDLATPAQAAAAGRAALALAAGCGLLADAAHPVSARTGAGLAALRAAIAAEARAARARADDGLAYLPVDRAFSRPGFGTVVTGTLRRGRLAAGDMVEIAPGGPAARIRGLQVHGAAVPTAAPGQRVAVNLRGVQAGQLARGAALATPGALPPSAWLSVRLRAVPGAPPLATTARLRALFGTQDIDARVRLLDRDVLAPGETALAQLHCAAPVSLPARERFILRSASPAATLAGGTVLDPETRRERRHTACVLARLAELADSDGAGIVAGEVRRAGVAGVALARLARVAGVSPAQAAGLLRADQALLAKEGVAMARPALAALAAVLPRILAPHPDGLARETLGGLLPKAGRAVLDEALAGLLAAGAIVREGAQLRVPCLAQDGCYADRARRTLAALEDALRQAGLCPPDLDVLAPDLARRRLVDRLVRQGAVVRAPDRVQKRDILFHRDAVAEARRRLATLLAGDGLPTGEIGAALGISRKFSVPLLEYLDSVRFTRRVAERRVLAEER
jgi:selenocysteine-specific elongation factor